MSGISIGTQLFAPAGYFQLKSNTIYHVLESNPVTELVRLIEFSRAEARPTKRKKIKIKQTCERKPRFKAVLHTMRRADFESGIKRELIKKREKQDKLPHWLGEARTKNTAVYKNQESKDAPGTRLKNRVTIVEPLVERAKEIFASADPDRLINEYARNLVPTQNETRFRTLFYTYMLFGQQEQSIDMLYGNCGRWSRQASSATSKRGKPSAGNGKHYGNNINAEQIKKIEDTFDKNATLGQTLVSVYRSVMTKVFGCKSEKVGKIGYKVSHPNGEPFPSYDQYKYWLHKTLTIEHVQNKLYGRRLIRDKRSASKGHYSQFAMNLMSETYVDAYSMDQRARGLVDGSILKPIWVTIIRDVLSGLKVGMGFSIGSETSAGYRMALFSAAIGGKKFGSLFGMEITEDEWPNCGLPPSWRRDRGPGSTVGALGRNEDHKPVVSGIAPAYSGQSKATVETSHPKSRKTREGPSFVDSKLRPFQLIRNEIRRVLRDNNATNMSNRVPPEMISEIPIPSPIGVWQHFDRLGRNDALHITLEEAIRSFATKSELTIDHQGAIFVGQRYDSKALRATGIVDRVARSQTIQVTSYHFEAAVRTIWCEIDDKIVELEINFAVPVSERSKFLTEDELEEQKAFRKANDSQFRQHVEGTNMRYDELAKEDTGQPIGGGSLRKGRARITSQGKVEMNETKDIFHGKKAA